MKSFKRKFISVTLTVLAILTLAVASGACYVYLQEVGLLAACLVALWGVWQVIKLMAMAACAFWDIMYAEIDRRLWH